MVVNPTQRKRIAEKYAGGMSAAEIAHKFCVSLDVVDWCIQLDARINDERVRSRHKTPGRLTEMASGYPDRKQ